jgi:hypothetical protein
LQLGISGSVAGKVVGGPYSAGLNYLSAVTENDQPFTKFNLAIDGLGNSWFANQDSVPDYMDMIPNLTQASASALSNGNWGANLTSADWNISADSAVAIDGGGNAWATNGDTYLVEFSSTNATMDYTNSNASAAILSPSSASIFGYSPSDGSANASGRSGGIRPLNTSTEPGLGVDGSGNLWVSSDADSTSIGHGSQLTEFIGLAVPVQTPLATALTNKGLGARP